MIFRLNMFRSPRQNDQNRIYKMVRVRVTGKTTRKTEMNIYYTSRNYDDERRVWNVIAARYERGSTVQRRKFLIFVI